MELLSATGRSATIRHRVIRWFEGLLEEGNLLAKAIDQLARGSAVIGVRYVPALAAPAVRERLEDAGAYEHHYFGRHTFD